ncbi:MAG: sulfurtransferase [Rhodocyclaceae bacterium]|nr:sulfurtransferase [Rhodocyclaceae bacterium]MBX3669713.1 sulfurtransferase [Rhodocyclaceae bacterium]
MINLSGHLIDAAQLHPLQQAHAALAVDCRHSLADPAFGRNAYLHGHIPGAVFAHIDDDLSGPMTGRNGRHPLPDAERLAARLAELGVNTDHLVVAYDDAGSMFAARLWWLLRWLGHERVAVLNGGLQAWQAAGFPLEAGRVALPPGDFRRSAAAMHTVDASDVQGALESESMLVVDARSPDRFRGENETLDPVGGHIPGAVNRFFRDNLDAQGHFHTPAHLREQWQAVLGPRQANEIVHQCGSGVTACHNLLAMEIAGLSGSRLYPGSWSEWCADPARPVARG